MRSISPRWLVIGLVLLVWAVWTLADDAPDSDRDVVTQVTEQAIRTVG